MTRWLGDLPRTLDDAHTQIRQLTAGVELWMSLAERQMIDLMRLREDAETALDSLLSVSNACPHVLSATSILSEVLA